MRWYRRSPTLGLTATLQGDGPFTVFAPTDAAFEAAGIDLSTFDNDEANATLADILLYHVLDGAVDAANVSDGLVATMANGDNATFTVDGHGLINDATVTTADVAASNGIIHVIDKVLLPPVEEPALEDITGVAAGTGVHGALVASRSRRVGGDPSGRRTVHGLRTNGRRFRSRRHQPHHL